MGIILDIIFLGIVLSSAYLGYKKGLVKLGSRFFAGIIAIVLSLILYTPLSSFLIKNTQIDENIQEMVTKHATNYLNNQNQNSENNSKIVDEFNNHLRNETVPNQARRISIYAIYIMTSIILYVLVKIILSIVFSMLGFVANLPILKQFDTIGGIVYGIARGILVDVIFIFIIFTFVKVNPGNKINSYIDDSYIMEKVNEKIVKTI